jgi:tRNA G10  N-methylase Trm11
MVVYLVQFVDEWIDFRLPEFISILELNGLNPIEVIWSWRNEQETSENRETDFQSFLKSYREPDTNLAGCKTNEDTDKPSTKQFLTINLSESINITQLFSRCVLVKSVYRLWGNACSSLIGLVKEIHSLPSEFLAPMLQSLKSWSIEIESFGKTFTMENKQIIRSFFSFLDFTGPVSLKSPELSLWIIMDYMSVANNMLVRVNETSYMDGIPTSNDAILYFGEKVYHHLEMKRVLQKYNLKKRLYLGPTSLDNVLAMILANLGKTRNGMVAYEPFMGTGSIAIALEHYGCFCIGSDIDPRVLRGEMYAGYDGESRKEINEKVILKNGDKRTNKKNNKVERTQEDDNNAETEGSESSISMPATTAVVSSSSSEVVPKKKSSYVSAKDYIHPRKVNSDVMSNFTDYSLPLPELIRMDHHLLNRHFHSNCLQNYFDIIITDPPYGIRAGARKSGFRFLLFSLLSCLLFCHILFIGKKGECEYNISSERRGDHIPSTQNYPVEEVMLDLLHTAAESLVLFVSFFFVLCS